MKQIKYTKAQREIFGRNVWIRRNLLKMSTEELGKLYGCTGSAVNSWERGNSIAPTNRMRDLSKILKCSINDLHRPYLVPKINFSESNKIVKTKEEPVMTDDEIIKEASKVFKNSFVETSTDSANTVIIKNTEDAKVTEEKTINELEKAKQSTISRIKEYLKKSGKSQSILCKELSMSLSSFNRVIHGALPYYNTKYKTVEDYLNRVEKELDKPTEIHKPELTVAKFAKTTTKVEEAKTTLENKVENATKEKIAEKSSISERINTIYNTLFNALDEVDKLKADIDKIEKVTAMLKEIQGL